MKKLSGKPVAFIIIFLVFAGVAVYAANTSMPSESILNLGIAGRQSVTPSVPEKVMTEPAAAPAMQSYSLTAASTVERSLDEDVVSSGSDTIALSILPSLDQKIIRSANIDVEVKKGQFDRSYGKVLTIIESVGGYVSQAKSSAVGGKLASGNLTLRVPSEDFEVVLGQLRKIGKVRSVDINSEEVSEEYVDLSARLRNWKAQELIMLDLMKKARTIGDSITIQNNLSQIQLEIERISGRIKFLDNRVAFTTISLFLTEPQAVVRPDAWGFKSAFKQALQASMSILVAMMILAGYIVPLALIAGILYIISVSVRKGLAHSRI